jgi:hypothetical protein
MEIQIDIKMETINNNIAKEENFFDSYILFRRSCLERGIFNVSEIIKLFEVWLHL